MEMVWEDEIFAVDTHRKCRLYGVRLMAKIKCDLDGLRGGDGERGNQRNTGEVEVHCSLSKLT